MANQPLPKGEYVWLASGICLTEATGERALGLPPLADPSKATAADMPAAAKYGDGLVPLLQKKGNDLRALGLPAGDALTGELGIIKAALHHYDETVKAFEKANAAAHAGNVKAFVEHWINGREHDAVADALFQAFDLPICASD